MADEQYIVNDQKGTNYGPGTQQEAQACADRLNVGADMTIQAVVEPLTPFTTWSEEDKTE